MAVHLGHLFAVRNVEWGTVGARFSLRYVPANLRVNGLFYLYDERFPVVFTLLAIAGLLSARFWRERAAMAIYFFAVLCDRAGLLRRQLQLRRRRAVFPDDIPADRRARRLGASRFIRGWPDRRPIGRSARRGTHRRIRLFQFLWYAPVVRATTEEAWAARADVRFARTFVRILPPNAYVLTHNPGMFHVWGVNAGQMSLATSNPAYVWFLADRYPGGIYLHWNFWCNVQDPAHREMCRQALTRVAELVANIGSAITVMGSTAWARSPNVAPRIRSPAQKSRFRLTF